MSKTKLMTVEEVRRAEGAGEGLTKFVGTIQDNAMQVIFDRVCEHLSVAAEMAKGVAVDDMGEGLLRILADMKREYTPRRDTRETGGHAMSDEAKTAERLLDEQIIPRLEHSLATPDGFTFDEMKAIRDGMVEELGRWSLAARVEGAEAMDAAWIAFIGDKLTAATKATPYAINEGHQADIIGQRRGFVALLETSTLDAREVVEKRDAK